MAQYKARVRQEADGSWVASAVALPNCWSRAAGRDEALAKLRDEIRYRIEYCPCTGVDDEYVRVEVIAAEEKDAAVRSVVLAAPAAGGTAARAHAAGAPPVLASPWSSARPATPASLSGAAGCPSEPARSPSARNEGAASSHRSASDPPRRDWRRWDD